MLLIDLLFIFLSMLAYLFLPKFRTIYITSEGDMNNNLSNTFGNFKEKLKKGTSIYRNYHLNVFKSNIYHLIFKETKKKGNKAYNKLLINTYYPLS